jgi:hypothetical protein
MIFIVLLLLLGVAILISKILPIISGYGAKTLCTTVFVCDRDPEEIIKSELGFFPITLGKFTINRADKSATGSVWGMAKKKAVFREGIGATLINGTTEAELRSQNFNISTPVDKDARVLWAFKTADEKVLKFDQEKLELAVHEAFKETGNSQRGTRAVIVVYDGKIVIEKYAKEFSEESKFAGWSMAKSVTNALIGILVKQNKLNVDAPAPVKEWKNDDRKNITIKDLLQMSSGLSWWEYYAGPSDATNMLYKERSMGKFAINKRQKTTRGTKFNYSSGSTNILSDIIRHSVGDDYYHRFPYEELFDKIGMLDTLMEVDAAGSFASSSYCLATARDWAKFGQLYLNDGIWNEERILPEGWVKLTTTPTTARSKKKEGRYGAHFWLNAGYGEEHKGRRYPDVPADCFRCQGYEGKYIWIIPSEKLVVVRLAFEKNNELDPNVFLPAVIRSFKK